MGRPARALAHPLDDGTAVVLGALGGRLRPRAGRDDGGLSPADGAAGARLAQRWCEELLGPLPVPPRHPVRVGAFGIQAMRPRRRWRGCAFRGERARALFAGMAAHSMLPLEQLATAAFGLMLGITGARRRLADRAGRSRRRIADALAAYLRNPGR